MVSKKIAKSFGQYDEEYYFYGKRKLKMNIKVSGQTEIDVIAFWGIVFGNVMLHYTEEKRVH